MLTICSFHSLTIRYSSKMLFSFIRHPKVQLFLKFFVDFLKHNAIHCTSYLANRYIHWTELIYWIISILVFLIFGSLNGMDLIASYTSRNSAITSKLSNMDMRTLYPSLTLCPHDILDPAKVEEFKRKYPRYAQNNPTLDEIMNLKGFLKNISKTTAKTAYEYGSSNTIQPEKYMQLIFNLSYNYDIRASDETVVKIMTEVGICYTVNNFLSKTLYTKHWRDLNPYPKTFADSSVLEMKTFNYSSRYPLNLNIKHNITGNITVYVHSPYDVPAVWTRPALIIKNQDIQYTLNAFIQEITYDDNNLFTETTVATRRCRNYNEANLNLFPNTYSRNLCLMECRALYIRKLCDCVPHFYGHTNWQDMEICNTQGLNCFNNYIDIFRTINSNSKSLLFKCDDCQPNCIEQIVVISLGVTANLKQSSINSTSVYNTRSSNASYMDLRIEHPPFQSYIRSVMYSKLDYVVTLSGALSSYLGFCIYGLCDIIYFFTVRIYWFRRGFRGTIDDV